ncbi:MAG TPA: GAF domain-containing protein, partial [Gemmatimonadales bacterium]|nr:GAF domain-containing protein [Gemmatimonadales bacterium]
MSELLRPRLLLLGEPAARPDGLERALVRSGFQVLEADRLALERVGAPLADAILLTAFQADDALARELAPVTTDAWRSVPRIAVLASDDPDQVVAAITLGADDALAAPVRPAELRARLEARLRACAELRRLREAVLAQRLMFDVFQDICASLRPDEVLETLVRRVGEALGVPRCSFVLTPPGERYGRVLAVWETPTVADLPVDLHRYPEVVEAVRSGQPVLIDDVATDPRLEAARRQWEELGRRPDLRCVAALPCGAQGRV